MNAIFAQRNQVFNGPGDGALVAIIAVVAGIVLFIYIIIAFFLWTLQKALSRCAPENRTMSPGIAGYSGQLASDRGYDDDDDDFEDDDDDDDNDRRKRRKRRRYDDEDD